MAQRIEKREVVGSPSTDRVSVRYNDVITREAYIDSQRAELFTEYVREHWNEPAYLRAGGAFKHVLTHLTPVIWDGELIVGSQSRYFLGTQVYPEYETWMLEGFRKIKREEERYMEGSLQEKAGERLGIYRIYPDDSQKILELASFWEGKDWRSQAEKYLQETHERLRHGQQMGFPTGFPPVHVRRAGRPRHRRLPKDHRRGCGEPHHGLPAAAGDAWRAEYKGSLRKV